MRVAIVMNGEFRTLPACWPRLLSMFAGHELDITVVCSEPGKAADFWRIVQPNRLLLIRDVEVDPNCKKGWWHPAHFSGLAQAAKSFEAAPTIDGIACDLMCRLRPDLEILEPLEPLESLDRDAVYIPRFSNWDGYNGQFMIGSPRVVKAYFRRATYLHYYGGPPGDEKFLKAFLDAHTAPVKRTKILFRLLRTDGTTDGPRFDSGMDVP